MKFLSFRCPGRWLAGITLFAACSIPASAQTTAQPPIAGLRDLPDISAPQLSATPAIPSSVVVTEPSGEYIPPSVDRLGRMPNLMSDFFARAGGAAFTTTTALPGGGGPTTSILTFTGLNAIAGNVLPPNNQLVFSAVPYTGPNGLTFTPPNDPGFPNPPNPAAVLTSLGFLDIQNALTAQFPFPQSGVGFTTPLAENAAFTQFVQSLFPNATFIANGSNATLTNQQANGFIIPGDAFTNVFLYQVVNPNGGPGGTQSLTTVVLAPNPVGGGMAGRNRYFENGSPVPRDRVYFYYSGVNDYQLPGRHIQINRYTFGGEKTFFDGLASIEARVPFAGTLNPSQTLGSTISSDYVMFGNVGVLGKVAVYRSENFILTAGLGLSLPTANDTRVRDNTGQTILRVNNEAILLQPIIGAAWAPTDRAFVQGGAQFDFDPMGNPVSVLQNTGGLTKIGQWQDQKYAYVHGGVGYWVYDRPEATWVTGVALTGELTYTTTMGAAREVAQAGSLLVAPLNSQINMLNTTVGVNALIANQATAAVGVVLPVEGRRQYDYALQVQLNWNFGRPRYPGLTPVSNQ